MTQGPQPTAVPAPQRPDSTAPAYFPRLVVLGASAGGLDALCRVFAAVPGNPGVAFVVIQHLSPDHRTMMDTLLARHTAMAVRLAEDGEQPAANTVLLIPPGKLMDLVNGCIVLKPKPEGGVVLPIDDFLRSAARQFGGRLTAVILSGTGSDGSRGIARVSEWGGRVFAQSPDTAEFDGMPSSAIATGLVDAVLSPEQIGARLAEVVLPEGLVAQDPSAPPDTAVPFADPLALAEDIVAVVNRIAGLVRQYTGLDLDQYKQDMLLRRIRRRMQLVGCPSLLGYAELLVGNEPEAQQLRRDVLIPVTRFFRDAESYAQIESELLPQMLQSHPEDQPFRVWVAATATGEEAYSLAIMLMDTCQAIRRWPAIKIYATDAEQRYLDVAAAGSYPESIANEVSAERLARYFTHKEGRYHIKPEVRSLIVFARHNMLCDPPFTRMNIVSCRNMLIYLRQPAQDVVLRRLHFALVPGGVLMLGVSESPAAVERDFTLISNRARVYRLTTSARPPLPPAMASPIHAERREAGPAAGPLAAQARNVHLLSQFLVSSYAPPAVLLDERRRVLHVSGDHAGLLRLREGAPSLDIADLLPDELSPLAAALLQRLERGNGAVRTPVVHRGAAAAAGAAPGGPGGMVMTATAIPAGVSGPEKLVVLTFEPAERYLPLQEEPTVVAVADPERERVTQIERELAVTRDTLQATIEELQTSNEELQATNEELMASNEELQSTNEELQSVNEELYSVNAEYQGKLKLLSGANADLEGMAMAVGVPKVFVDEQLRLLRLTPEAEKLFSFREADVGRSLEDFSNRLDYPEMLADLRRALGNGDVVEREVRSDDGRWFLARVVAYGVRSDRPAAIGAPARRAVASFTDVTAVRSMLRLQAVIDAVPAQLAVVDASGLIVSVNGAWRQFAESNGDRGLAHTGPGHNYMDVVRKAKAETPPGPEREQLAAAEQGLAAVTSGQCPHFMQVYPCHAPGERRWFEVHATPLKLDGGGALITHVNVTRWVLEREGATNDPTTPTPGHGPSHPEL